MKTRDSGMPDEPHWESFFDPDAVLDRLGLSAGVGNVVEFGCGYGTFTIPAAYRTTGTVYAVDIEPEMVAAVARKASRLGHGNVLAIVRDFVEQGTGLPDEHADYAMLFNILHAENPGIMLREARRVLKPGGILGIMHWNYDPSTPRGPKMDIRPRPEQCESWAIAAGFNRTKSGIVDLPPYHYGMAMQKPRSEGRTFDQSSAVL
jgi:SAM-dependent methyltransferase